MPRPPPCPRQMPMCARTSEHHPPSPLAGEGGGEGGARGVGVVCSAESSDADPRNQPGPLHTAPLTPTSAARPARGEGATANANVPSSRASGRQTGRKCAKMCRNVPECARKKTRWKNEPTWHMVAHPASARVLPPATPRYAVLRHATVFAIRQNEPTAPARVCLNVMPPAAVATIVRPTGETA